MTELLPQSRAFSVGSVRLSLRYDMNALLKPEQAGLEYFDVFTELSADTPGIFLSAGLTENIGAERAAKIAEMFPEKTAEACREALLLALPKYDPAVIPDTSTREGGLDFSRLRCLICDEMGKPEDFFWNSTLRELISRWEQYSVLKGYSKPRERMQMFDTEGME